jgi:hypothetical protein
MASIRSAAAATQEDLREMSGLVQTFDYVMRTAVDWLFRRPRSLGLLLVRSGATVLVASGSAWFIRIVVNINGQSITAAPDSAGQVADFVQIGTFATSLLLIVAGVWWENARQRAAEVRANRRRVIVIEQRGLGNTADSPLVQSVPTEIEGARELLLIDIRERITEGVVSAPNVALDRVIGIKRDLESRTAGRDAADIDLVYGGLLPVPFTFLTGWLLDDESRITSMDWDRGRGTWRQLDGIDDGDRFVIPTLPEKIGREAVLALSVSYQVDLEKIAAVFTHLPLVHMQVNARTTECHWSADKQQALAQQFLDTVKALGERGVEQLHLVIAAQNSLVFRFGRIYDKRNLPAVVIYQYERSSSPAYPWGVRLSPLGVERPEIVRTSAPAELPPA